MEKLWFKNYPDGSEHELDTSEYDSIFDISRTVRMLTHRLIKHI